MAWAEQPQPFEWGTMSTAQQTGLAPANDQVAPGDLKFDLRNFRMAETEFGSETEVVQHLIEEYDVEELILSILTAGWLDYEPLIVTNDKTVIEGNRRLAALRLITEPSLREATGYTVPKIEPEHPNARPKTVDGLILSLRAGLSNWSVSALHEGESSQIKRRQTNSFRPGTSPDKYEHDFAFELARI